ncbi:MAG: hypothetical protein U0457_13750 [Candidatus Sericytochromatia bacterium]
MKLGKKLGIVAFSLLSLSILGAGGLGSNHKLKEKFVPRENIVDSNLNGKMNELKHKMKEQKAGINEATELFKKVFPATLEGTAKVETLNFEEGSTAIVILDNPIPIKILFKGQFLLDNKTLAEKIGKEIKFKLSDVQLVEEPVLETLRIPFTDSKFWIYANFSNYGKIKDGDFVDTIKSGTIPY